MKLNQPKNKQNFQKGKLLLGKQESSSNYSKLALECPEKEEAVGTLVQIELNGSIC